MIEEQSTGGALHGKVVLVTGASRGIGAAIAEASAAAGADLALMAPQLPIAVSKRITAMGRRTVMIAGDVGSSDDANRAVGETIRALGHIDVLVNNAAVLEVAPFLDVSEDSFERVMRVNVKGVFLMTQAAGRQMAQQRAGVVINIGSDLAVRGRAGYFAYAVSKGAVLQLTRAAAVELGAFGVRVVMLSPAVTNTELAAPALADPVVRDELISKGTLGTFNEPEDVAAAAVFLASPAARTVTGCNWPIDAGVSAK